MYNNSQSCQILIYRLIELKFRLGNTKKHSILSKVYNMQCGLRD